MIYYSILHNSCDNLLLLSLGQNVPCSLLDLFPLAILFTAAAFELDYERVKRLYMKIILMLDRNSNEKQISGLQKDAIKIPTSQARIRQPNHTIQQIYNPTIQKIYNPKIQQSTIQQINNLQSNNPTNKQMNKKLTSR